MYKSNRKLAGNVKILIIMALMGFIALIIFFLLSGKNIIPG